MASHSETVIQIFEIVSWQQVFQESVLDTGNGSANEISSFLDKVDGGEVVHQLEMVLVQGGRNLFGEKHLKPQKSKQRKYETDQRQEVCAGSTSKGQRIVLLIHKQVLLTSLNLIIVMLMLMMVA